MSFWPVKEVTVYSVVFSDRLQQSQPNKAALAMSVRLCARTCACTCVRTSTESFPDLHEIRFVGRGRRVMDASMSYYTIQGQGHKTFKVGNSAIFKVYFLPHFQCDLASDCRFLN